MHSFKNVLVDNVSYCFGNAGHFLLTEMLIEKMIETSEKSGIEGRIINVSSVIHSWVKRDAFHFHQLLNGTKYNHFFIT